MSKNQGAEIKSFYLDGVKYLDNLLPGDFSGKLKAFTYPDEFDSVNGIPEIRPGLNYYNQRQKVLIYRIEQKLVMMLRE